MDGEVKNVSMKKFADMNSDELAVQVLFKEYPDELLDFGGIACVIFMIIGIPGNLITVYSLARYKKVRNATAIFIINMSVADLLFCCINLPLAISTFWTRRWSYGVFMCQFFVFARYSLSGVAVFTVLAITINRYIMISHPRLYTKLYTSRSLGIQVVSIWMGAFLSLAPTWAKVWGCFAMDEESSFCVIMNDVHGGSPVKVMFVCAFVIPFLAICYCYVRIFFIVRKATVNSRGAVCRDKEDKEESSFLSSTAEKSPDSEQERAARLLNSPEHPRVQSLRSSNIKVSIANEPSSTTSRASNLNFGRSIRLRKSQLLNIAPTSKDKRLLTMIIAIMIAFFVFHLPITIIKASHEITSFNPKVIMWSYLLRYMTTCINPIIYVVMSHEYRKAYKKAMASSTCKNKYCFPR